MASSISSLLTLTTLALAFFLLRPISPAHALSGNVQVPQSNKPRWMSFRRKEKEKDDIGFNQCKESDIVISQAVGRPLPNGIPTFSVQICSTCPSYCPISDVHVSCGLFASAKLVNPRVFRRVGPNDCVVNDGKAMESGVILSFVYANSFSYPLGVSRARMC